VVEFFAQVVLTMGTVDVLVHAAGGFSGGTPVADVRLEEWENMLTLNLRTAFLVSRSALRVMRSRNSGRIICIAASAGVTPAARRAPYAISKRGVITLTETIAEEVKGTGITANAIAPSIVLTDANRKSMPGADFSKWVTPEEIAALVAFLCSDQARSISGNVIRIYGGV
jgi:NAD(P)-dependent dehydrogenase (short-subunit alcohol dehydrogenase family)